MNRFQILLSISTCAATAGAPRVLGHLPAGMAVPIMLATSSTSTGPPAPLFKKMRGMAQHLIHRGSAIISGIAIWSVGSGRHGTPQGVPYSVNRITCNFLKSRGWGSCRYIRLWIFGVRQYDAPPLFQFETRRCPNRSKLRSYS